MKKLPFTPLRHSKSFLKYFSKEISEKLEQTFDFTIGLQATNFNYNIKIKFTDGSEIKFKDAFYVLKEKTLENEDDDLNEYAIFTEHHGYFFFYSDSVKKIKEKKVKRIVYSVK